MQDPKFKSALILHGLGNNSHCPLEHAKYLAGKLSGELIVKKGQGHFNLGKSSKYKKFPLMLEILEVNKK